MNLVKKVELQYRAKVRRNRDFSIFKMAAAAILDFRNLEFLTVGTVRRFELCQRAKFYRNRSNCDRDRDFSIF